MLYLWPPVAGSRQAWPLLVPSPTCRDGGKAEAPNGLQMATRCQVQPCGGLRIAARCPPATAHPLPHPGSAHGFFYAHRSLDRPGMKIEIEFLSYLLGQLTRSNRLARNHVFLNKLEHCALHLVRAMRTTLAGQ